MKNLLKKLKSKVTLHYLAFLAIALSATALYCAGVTVGQGWATYAIQLPALIILAVTALARVNDIREDRAGWIWQVRRVGLSFVGVAAVSLMFNPFAGSSGGDYPTWKGLLLVWGFALTWISTPGMPPFWKYVSGEARLPKSMT